MNYRLIEDTPIWFTWIKKLNWCYFKAKFVIHRVTWSYTNLTVMNLKVNSKCDVCNSTYRTIGSLKKTNFIIPHNPLPPKKNQIYLKIDNGGGNRGGISMIGSIFNKRVSKITEHRGQKRTGYKNYFFRGHSSIYRGHI